jgi:hypothetical protein
LNWDKRQFVSDSSTERVARHRQKKKQASNATETLQERPSNAIDTETDTDKKQNNRKVGSRLSNDLFLPDDWREFCKQTRPELNPAKTFDQFRDYWIAQPGQKGVKLDWDATWRNWVRNTNAPKQNPADIVKLTVPSSNEPDPALEKIKADEKVTRPPTPEERAIFNSYKRKA